jgi:hypothetical protein
MATKLELGFEIYDSILNNDVSRLQKTLALVETVDDDDVSDISRPLCSAIWLGRFDMAQLLIEHGADPNYRSARKPEHVMCMYLGSRKAFAAVAFLLRNGSHIPQTLSSERRAVVESYVYRDWTPENHHDWPVPLRKQVLAVLCSVKSTEFALSPYLFSRLFSFAVAAHFVWE